MFMIISMTMSLPLQLAFEVSPCQTGAVPVSVKMRVMHALPTRRGIYSIANACNNSPNDHLGYIVRRDLDDSSNAHYRRSQEHGLFPTQRVTYANDGDRAEETPDIVDGRDCADQ